jgi:hypothetical protein
MPEGAVSLDVRGAFAFGLQRVRDSQGFGWNERDLKDKNGFVRRLSLLGVEPSRPVVIVVDAASLSRGQQLALELKRFCVRSVMVVDFEQLRSWWTKDPSVPPKNGRIWDPKECEA